MGRASNLMSMALGGQVKRNAIEAGSSCMNEINAAQRLVYLPL